MTPTSKACGTVVAVSAALLAAFGVKAWRYAMAVEPSKEDAIVRIERTMAAAGWHTQTTEHGAPGMPATLLTFAKSGCARPAHVAILGKHPELGGFIASLIGSDAVLLRPAGMPVVAIAPAPSQGDTACTPIGIHDLANPGGGTG